MPPVAQSQVKSPEEIFSQPFKAGHVDGVSISVDKIDDLVQKTANPIAAAKAFYTANNATLNAAADALVNLNMNEGLKRAARDVLAPVRKILDGLDSLTKVHPFLAVAVLLVKGVVEIEIKRRENDKRTLSLVLQMADMMGTLLQLKDVKDPTLATENGDTVAGRIQQLMSAIENDVKECGKTIDTYRKQHLLVKFVKAPMWSDKLVAVGNGFGERKVQIQFALSIHTAVGVDQVNAAAVEIQAKLDEVLKYVVEYKSPIEIEWEKEMDKLGGRKACLDDPIKMGKLAKMFAEKATPSSNADPEKKKTGNPDRPGGRDKDTLNASQKHALSASVDTLIEENSTLYERKLNQQTKQIEDAIKESTSIILSRIDSGPHERIKHPVIKRIWEEMKWRSSIKARTFVLALHDFYLDLATLSGVTILQTPAVEQPQTSSSEDTSNGTSDTSPGIIRNELVHNPEDDWCLQYLTIFHVPAIMEAFDDDASGYVKIKEVNDFTDAIPKGWTLLQWLSYWAAGWEVEVEMWRKMIKHMLYKIDEGRREVLLENNWALTVYMNYNGFESLRLLVSPEPNSTTTSDGLLGLANARIDDSIVKLRGLLGDVMFEIDSVDSLTQLANGRRIESYVYPLLYVLLRHHGRIVQLAKTKILDNRELVVAGESISYIMDAIVQRKTSLEETLRQQRLDPEVQLKYVAGGMFAGFNYEPHDLEYDPSTNDLAASIDETIAGEADLKENELKYAIGGRTVEGYEEPWEESELSTFKGEAADADSPRSRALWRMAINAVLAQVKERLHRRTWAAMQERRDRRLEYIELKYKYYVYCDFVNTIYDSSASTFLVTLADEEYARINELTDKFTQRDYDFYESLVEIKFRRTMRHNEITCDGCVENPVHGNRYHCLQCPDFDFCERCERNPPAAPLSGATTHDTNEHEMIKVPWAIARPIRRKYKARAEELANTNYGLDKEDEQAKEPEGKAPETAAEAVNGKIPDTAETNGLESSATTEVSMEPAKDEAVQTNDVEVAVKPALGRTLSCSAGCGRSELIVHYRCMDCEDEYILCPECDEAFTKNHLDTNSTSQAAQPTKKEEAEDGHAAVAPPVTVAETNTEANLTEPVTAPAEGSGTTESKQREEEEHKGQPAHHPRHVVLKIKELKKKVAEEEEEEASDPTVLIARLQEQMVERFGEMEARIGKLEGLLLRLLTHMGVPET